MRFRGVRSRHRRPLRSGTSGRRALHLRDLGRLRACRIARPFAGIDRLRQERCLRSGGTIVYGENCRSLRPHILEYNRYREVTTAFVRDQIAIGNETVSTTAQHFDLRFDDYEFRVLETSLLGAFQINNAAIAVTLFLLWLRRTRPGEARCQTSKPPSDRASARRAGPDAWR